MIEKIFIPTVNRPNDQITYNSLPDELKKRVTLVVQEWEYDQYSYDCDYLVLPKEFNTREHLTLAKTRHLIHKVGTSMKYCMVDDDMILHRRNAKYFNKAQQQNKSNPDAGETEITALATQTEITKNAEKIVKRFFDDCVKVSEQRQQKWKRETYSLFQLDWFGKYAENKDFVIDNYTKYSQVFTTRFFSLVADSPDTVTIDGKVKIKCDWFKKNIATFSSGKYQRKCYKMFMEGISEKDLGIIFRDKDRSKSRNVKEKHLALQGHKCFIDILIDGFENAPTLKLDDAIWGHDTGWALGGSTLDGKVIRKSHNDNMADDENFEQYVTRVKNRDKNLESVA